MYGFAVSLVLDKCIDLFHVPPAHHSSSFGVLFHRLSESKRPTGHADASLVLVGKTLVGWKTSTGCGAILERKVSLFLELVELLVILHLVLLPLFPLVFGVGWIEIVAVIGPVVPIHPRLLKSGFEVPVVYVSHEQRRFLAGQRRVVGFGSLALKVPKAVDFFAVHVVHRHDRVAPVRWAEREGRGFLAIDGRPLFEETWLARRSQRDKNRNRSQHLPTTSLTQVVLALA